MNWLSRLSNLQQRIVAGIIGGILIIAAIALNEWTYFSLFLVLCFLCLKEFYNLLDSAEIKTNKGFGIASGMIIYVLIFLIEKQELNFSFYFLLFPFLFILFITELFKRHERPFFNIAFTFLGIIYIAIPFGLLHVSAYHLQNYSAEIILGILFILWSNDVGGYIAGMTMGKHKLFLRVSPKKTWEGSIGGGILALGIAILISLWFKQLDMIQWMGLAVIIVIFGSYGDLVESLLKRSLAVKDSGASIPGHGGFLDRFDGLILSSPFIAAFLKIISGT